MKRIVVSALALLLWAGNARAGGIGLGAFAGMSYPVLQDDTGEGALVGLRAPVSVVPMLTVEPFYASSRLADKVTMVADVPYAREGFDERAYGVNLMLATGGPLSFYPFAGIGKTTLERTGFESTFTTYDVGVGLSVSPLPKLSVDLRAELQAVVDGDVTRKFGNATAGVSYRLFGLP